MEQPTSRTIASCVPLDTPFQQRLLQQAKKMISDRGEEALVEELTRVVTDLPCELLPYVAVALQELEEHPLTVETMNIPEHLKDTNSINSVTSELQLSTLHTKCTSIDHLLGGGLPVGTGAIFEISGKAGVGKTQIAAQLALMAPAPLSRGGLETPSIYAFTEGRPPIRRMEEIDQALTNQMDLPPKSLLKGIVTEKILSSDELLQWTEQRLPYLLRETGARLVIIDSVTAIYRPEFVDPLSRADHLFKMVIALRHSVAAVKGVCVCINQVSQALDGLNSLNATVPALGHAWSNCVSTRLFISRIRDRRFMRVTHSSYLPTTDGPGNLFLITTDGVVDDESHAD